MNPTAVFAIAFIVTLLLLACSQIGGYDSREDERRRTRRERLRRSNAERQRDSARAEVRELLRAYAISEAEHERTREALHAATNVRPLHTSPAADRVAGLIAENQARRAWQEVGTDA